MLWRSERLINSDAALHKGCCLWERIILLATWYTRKFVGLLLYMERLYRYWILVSMSAASHIHFITIYICVLNIV